MNFLNQSLRVAFLCFIAINHSPFANAQARLFQDGERVCFIGDSITHEGDYHSYVYLYYLTRFPDREIRISNRGISGDSAWSVLRRFEDDVATTEPTISTIMLGMNDVGRGLYGSDKTDEASIQKQNEQLDLYRTRMGRLIDRVQSLDSEIILITPSIYDQTAELEKVNQYGVNDALATCATFLRETADTEDFGLIDFHAPMTAINAAQQLEDSAFSIVGQDRVHPNRSLGHFAMAYLFLKDQGAPRYVSYLNIDAEAGDTIETRNAAIFDFEDGQDNLQFTLIESALPFPTTPNLGRALEIVPFQQELNQQILRIQNLDHGTYELRIDGEKIGNWNSEEFSMGINLSHKKTPQLRQSQEVRKLNEQRVALERKLRKVAFTVFNSGLLDEKIDLSDHEALSSFFDAKIAGMNGKSYQGYFRDQFDAFLDIYPKLSAHEAEMDALHLQLYETNQPKPRAYSIEKIQDSHQR